MDAKFAVLIGKALITISIDHKHIPIVIDQNVARFVNEDKNFLAGKNAIKCCSHCVIAVTFTLQSVLKRQKRCH